MNAMTTVTYRVSHLHCAGCAEKIERQVRALPEVQSANLVLATNKLYVTAEQPDKLLGTIQQIAASVEEGVVIEKEETEPEEVEEEQPAGGWQLLAGGGLLAAGVALSGLWPDAGVVSVITGVMMVAAYLLLGGRVLMTAVRNIRRGQVFDEYFLMSIATLGAFAIGDWPEAVGVMLFYRAGEYLEARAVANSRRAVMQALDMRPETVQLVTGTGIETIPAAQAAVGDILLVRPGDRIPLDGQVVEGSSRLDTAPVTGEPVPVAVAAGDQVLSGCINQDGVLRIQVQKVLEESMVTRILRAAEQAATGKPKIQRFITRFARVYTPIVVAIALLTAVIPSLITGQWSQWIYAALTFLVISCPCALVISVPLTYFAGIGAGSRLGILFKDGAALEALHRVQAVVMDKTGTVTNGRLAVEQCVPAAGAGIGPDQLLALSAAAESGTTHPVGISILEAARSRGVEVEQPARIEELAGKGVVAQLSAGTLLCGNRALLASKGVALPDSLPGNGTLVLVALNGQYLGYITVVDTIKSDAAPAIETLHQQGLGTILLTGDNAATAEAVAGQVGIQQVHAELLPEDKLNLLKKVRAELGPVLYVGDGINDAPVLAGADVGAAMGSGADAALEAADMVFLTSRMEAVPQAVRLARRVQRVAVQNIWLALVIKGLVMLMGFLGLANLWFAVFADTGVALLCILNSIRLLRKE